MQEEITQRTVSLSVEAGKMMADLLQKAVKKVLEEMQKKPSQRTLHQGKQTLHQLKQHGASLTNIEITEQNIKAFSVVAKKYDIDYARSAIVEIFVFGTVFLLCGYTGEGSKMCHNGLSSSMDYSNRMTGLYGISMTSDLK